MSFAQYIPDFPTVLVTTAWDHADHVAGEIETQWGIDWGSAHTVVLALWQGPADTDDFAKVTITNGSAASTVDFDSMPEEGERVYVMSITVTS